MKKFDHRTPGLATEEAKKQARANIRLSNLPVDDQLLEFAHKSAQGQMTSEEALKKLGVK